MDESTNTQSAATDTPAKAQKHRSPSYPAIDLKTAVGRAAAVQKIAGTHPAPLPAVIQAWGYSPKSSNGILTIAALKKYGLFGNLGKGDVRKIQLTRLGQEILFFSEETGEWLERVRTAALTPTVYRELWKKYGPRLPENSVMLHDLIFERGFSEAAAKDVLRQFRATVAYAQLADADAMVAGDEDDNESHDNGDGGPTVTPPATLTTPPGAPDAEQHSSESKRTSQTVQVTYSPTEWALLQAKFPMSNDDWDAMIEVLQAMKRGLVSPDG